MQKSIDCSLNGYLQKINEEYGQCLKKHLGGPNDIACIARAAILGVRDLSSQCYNANENLDCTPKGYITAVIESIDVESKMINVGIKKISNKIINNVVPQGIGSSIGCLIGGAIGGVGGLYLTRNQLGARIGAVQGCKWGSKLGTQISDQLVGPYRIIVNISGKIATIKEIANALDVHSNLCKAQKLSPIEWEREQGPKIIIDQEKRNIENLNSQQQASPIVEKVLEPQQATPIVEEALEPLQMPNDNLLQNIGDQLLQYAGQISGISPAVEEIKQLHEIMTTLAQNPIDGIHKIAEKYLQTPRSMIDNVLKGPENIFKQGEIVLNQPIGNCMGVLAFCGSILSFMSSVTWIVNFIQDPKHMAIAALKMPYTMVKSVIDLGISFIRNPGKTAINLCKSLIQAPVNIFKGFVRAIRFKKRKKKHREISISSPQIDPQEQKRLFQKYLEDLTGLYISAKYNWFIDPFKTIEEYHYDLMKDFEDMPRNICNSFFDFPTFLKTKLDQEDFATVWSWSPRAHPKETLAPPEVVQAYLEIGKSMVRLEVASSALNATHQINLEVNRELNSERQKLQNNMEQISALLDNNEERIKQALRARIAARQNQ